MDFGSLPRQLPDYRFCQALDERPAPSWAVSTWPALAPQPFAWQSENQLLLLDVDGPHWLVAELHFVAEECRYIEVRCVSYDWPREAIGALLARALTNGDDALITTVEQLHAYMYRHYGISLMDC
jgi:hypothetical protein